MRVEEQPTCTIDIHIAGDLGQAQQACREYCFAVGLCVTVQPQLFIYTGGEEAGVRIGLLNYPRFPTTPEELFAKARDLADLLRVRLCQTSALIRASDKTVWITTRA